MLKILLVEPNFPIPLKSKNHKNFLPIGLLKIASYMRERGIKVKLVRGVSDDLFHINNIRNFKPDEIWITSLFTYWAEYVRSAVESYRRIFPKTKIVVGGIYASLMPNHCKEFTGCDAIHVGVLKEAERYFPSYDLLRNYDSPQLDYQIIHTSRGCNRKCSFCGTWKIEPKFNSKMSIKGEIKFRKIVFYDNNFLANIYIKNILRELIELKKEKKILWCESQSGFDGRILIDKPYLAKMIKQAGFRYPRIAWDGKYTNYPKIEKQMNLLLGVGYSSKDLFVFVLYNWKVPFIEMELKRKKCWEWKVQIADCRYRPLDQIFDYYSSRKPQSDKDYYIYPIWTDEEVKRFRKNVRRQNICVRQGLLFYSRKLESKQLDKALTQKLKKMQKRDIKKFLKDAWFPEDSEV